MKPNDERSRPSAHRGVTVDPGSERSAVPAATSATRARGRRRPVRAGEDHGGGVAKERTRDRVQRPREGTVRRPKESRTASRLPVPSF